MYGNNFYVKGYTPKYPFIAKFTSLANAEKYAKRLISRNYYNKSEIYLVNGIYKLNDYKVKTYINKNGKIMEIKNERKNKNV